MTKVLIITYYWPPGSGAGVQRWLKFSKYLPEFGWEPVILTVDPGYATYPATDTSMEAEIDNNLRIYKTKATDYFRLYNSDKKKIPSAGFASADENGIKAKIIRFIRGNFFIPDPRKGWNKFAIKKACEIIESESLKHIITTSPPHSTQLIGLRLKKLYPDLKWIADLRDPWTDIYYYDQFYPTPVSRFVDRKYETRVLRNSDRIITVGRSLKELFTSKYSGIKDKVEVITNGFDEDDFKDLIPDRPSVFTISYIGTLSDAYPIAGFMKALSNFQMKGNEVKLRFTGTVSPRQRSLVLSGAGQSQVEFLPFTDHTSAIKYMADSNALLLIIPQHHSSRSIITGKIFEYIATYNPVICLGPPDGDAAEIIKKTGSGSVFDYSDSQSIENYLIQLTSNQHLPQKQLISSYSRKSLAQHVASLLDN